MITILGVASLLWDTGVLFFRAISFVGPLVGDSGAVYYEMSFSLRAALKRQVKHVGQVDELKKVV